MSDEKPKGVSCRKCGCADLRVIQTWKGVKVIKRTRVCRHCGTRTLTRETVAGSPAG